MEQHAVPQNISSYHFHLVGDMTLKQFGEIAAGVIAAIIIYALPLPTLIRVPFIIISLISGALLAFVPFQERPLEQWIVAFMRSTYAPTLFHWEKVEGVKYFKDENIPVQIPGVPPQATAVQVPSTIPSAPSVAKLEDTETGYLNKVSKLFNVTAVVPVSKITQPQPQVLNPQPQAPNYAHSQTGSILTAQIQDQGTVRTPQANPTQKEVVIPATNLISLDQKDRPQVIVQEIPTNSADEAFSEQLGPTFIGQTMTPRTTTDLHQAHFSKNAAPPSIPEIANTVSGQVMDASGNIIEGAILEIRDDKGRAVRALKTNKAGHFLIVTPLINGSYQIVLEKEGFSFDPIKFEADGNIIQPIAIKAKP